MYNVPRAEKGEALKVKCAIFADFEEETAKSSGYILDCGVFYSACQ